jgi:hypothetical protein
MLHAIAERAFLVAGGEFGPSYAGGDRRATMSDHEPRMKPDRTDGGGGVPCMAVPNAGLLPHVKAVLDAAGVTYYIKNEGVQGLLALDIVLMGSSNPFTTPIVMVDPAHLDLARTVLRDFEPPATPTSEPDTTTAAASVRCSHCHRDLEAEAGDERLTHCYHCGWPL